MFICTPGDPQGPGESREVHLREAEGHKGTDDDCCIENVPQVTTVGTRMKEDSQVDHLVV